MSILHGNILGTQQGYNSLYSRTTKGFTSQWDILVFVVAIRLETNEVVIGENDDAFSTKLYANNINLMSADKIEEPIRARAVNQIQP